MYPKLKRTALAALVACLLFAPAFAGEVEDLRAMMFRKDYNQVIALTDPATSQSADHAEIRFIRALALAESGKMDEAIEMFVKLSSEFPQQGVLHNNLAVLYAQKNQLEKARDALEKAVDATPDYPVAHENMGDLYARLALQSYKKSYQLDAIDRVQAKLKHADALSRLSSQSDDAAAQSHAGRQADKPQTTGSNETATAALEAWAQAWSRQDVDAYLAAYSPQFTPEGKSSLAAWKKERRSKLKAPKSIQVDISDVVSETISEDKTRLRFKQRYASDRFKNQINKLVTMEKQDGRWLIVEEIEDK